ncbi:MAG: hypothetical protein M3P11_13310 [Actinomycetota bacterium]|nr:hypothetical protein [Actinomycetota bacterium]
MLILTGLAQTDVPIQTTQVSDTIWFATLGFGAFALLLVGVVQVYRTRKQQDDRLVSFVPFARTYGLIVIATLAAALALSNIDVDAKTGAYALLGTTIGPSEDRCSPISDIIRPEPRQRWTRRPRSPTKIARGARGR